MEKLPPSQVFSVCGEIVEIRMIQDQKGAMKVNFYATLFPTVGDEYFECLVLPHHIMDEKVS